MVAELGDEMRRGSVLAVLAVASLVLSCGGGDTLELTEDTLAPERYGADTSSNPRRRVTFEVPESLSGSWSGVNSGGKVGLEPPSDAAEPPSERGVLFYSVPTPLPQEDEDGTVEGAIESLSREAGIEMIGEPSDVFLGGDKPGKAIELLVTGATPGCVDQFGNPCSVIAPFGAALPVGNLVQIRFFEIEPDANFPRGFDAIIFQGSPEWYSELLNSINDMIENTTFSCPEDE